MREQDKPQTSTHRRILKETASIMKRRKEISLSALKSKLEQRLRVKIRTDYLAANMLGQAGYAIDCETRVLLKLE